MLCFYWNEEHILDTIEVTCTTKKHNFS